MTDETATIVVKSALSDTGERTMGEQMLSVEDVAEELGISATMIRRHIRNNNLKATLVGNTYVILRKDLEEFKQHRRGPGRPPEDD